MKVKSFTPIKYINKKKSNLFTIHERKKKERAQKKKTIIKTSFKIKNTISASSKSKK